MVLVNWGKQRPLRTLWVEILLAMLGLTLVVSGTAAMLDGARVTKAVGVAMLAATAVMLVEMAAVEAEMVVAVAVGEMAAAVLVKPMVV
jgi:hypothetical protein